MKKMQWLSLFLALVLVLAAVTACGKKKETTKKESEKTAISVTSLADKVTVTWELCYFPDDTSASAVQVLEICSRTVDCLRQNIFSAYGWETYF